MSKPFQYKKRIAARRQAVKVNASQAQPEVIKPAEAEGLIYGRVPGSVEEWRIAVSLWKYRLPFDYQVPIRGGDVLRGGQVIDFVVYNPFAQPLQLFGKRFHSGEIGAEDAFKLRILNRYYNRITIVIWDYEVPDQETSHRVVGERLGLIT